MKKYIVGLFITVLFFSPVLAKASTLGELEMKVQQLTAQVNALQYYISTVLFSRLAAPINDPIVEPAPVVLPAPVVSPKPIIYPAPIVPTLPIAEPVVPTTSIPRPINPTLPSGLIVTPSVSTTSSAVVTPAPASIFYRDLNLNFSGTDVKAFQQYLFDQKFLTTAPTGFFGPATCSAAIAWKRSRNLAADTCFIGSLSRTILNNSIVERNLVGLGAVSVEKKASTTPIVTPPSGPYKVEVNFVNQTNPANAQATISKINPAPVITSLQNVSCPCSGGSCSNAPSCTTAYMSGTQVKVQITSPSVVGYSWIFKNYVPGTNLGTGFPVVTKISGCSQTANAQDTFCEFIMPAQNIEIHIEAASPQPQPLACTATDLAMFSIGQTNKTQLSSSAVSLSAKINYAPVTSASGMSYKTSLVYWPASQPQSNFVVASGAQSSNTFLGMTTSSATLIGTASPLLANTTYNLGILIMKYATNNPAVTAYCMKTGDITFYVSNN